MTIDNSDPLNPADAARPAARDEAETEGRQPRRDGARRRRLVVRRRFLNWARRSLGAHLFSSLTRRIVILNVAALVALVSGILYLNQFRAGLIDARVESLLTQGEIIAAAIAGSASVDTNVITVDPDRLLQMQAGEDSSPSDDSLQSLDFPINPERVAPILQRLISPTKTRARIYDREGVLLLDSRYLYSRGQILRSELPAPDVSPPNAIERVWERLKGWFLRGELPTYRELSGTDGRGYPEVARALGGAPASVVRVTTSGEIIVSVAVPIQRSRAVLGVLLLSTQGGDIEAILRAERFAIVRVFLVAATISIISSILLAGTIAGPMRRLATAADRVRRGVKAREPIPDFSGRHDEIGHLARALRDMTDALYKRMDAIEAFAADVSHELKNPLTSLKSAVETLPLARTEESRQRLLGIIQHDVRRLNRLISDISDASRLDAELSRQDSAAVDVAAVLEAVVAIQRGLSDEGPAIVLEIEPVKGMAKPYEVVGHDSRLGQVFTNLIDNARSFSPPDGTVRVCLSRLQDEVEIVVEDDGPGIRAEQIDRIFERFYTDRPEREGFGNNSGLGLSISKQIVEAHQGRIWVENRTEDEPDAVDPEGDTGPRAVLGARFVVRIPAGPLP
ncbi:two-component system, OmpR family, sensor histidine kinase ChvG [Pseudoxanthobacter soli DSM 19599]|uniref:histidine kinase n=1 Tax=Pseudoxanthobacter soli DSM 19599 TaxID=1123029 RepID=A0A1M7ZIC7_9HYPH|nr:two-component system, OmpR family, sensor histidine kinase ChvG [Pseudoxanthobacter soli DSM 19599]